MAPGAPETVIVHATTVSVDGRGAMIRGASGRGKSGLALELIALGARLVADDRTALRREGQVVMANAPDAIRDRIEARGVGILQAPSEGPVPVTLIIDLDRDETERLPPERHETLLGFKLPVVLRGKGPFAAALIVYLKHGRVA